MISLKNIKLDAAKIKLCQYVNLIKALNFDGNIKWLALEYLIKLK